MPELPEVETIRRELRSLILNKKVKDFQCGDKIFLKKPKSLSSWKKTIRGLRIKEVERKGKFLSLRLSNGFYLVIHLKLTGQLIYGGNDDVKIKILFSDGSFLSYKDKRRFGEWFLLKELGEIPLLKEIGIDPMEETFTLDILRELLEKKNTTLYRFLLDQRVISGIGNIYANEILYRAKLSPFRRTKPLKEEELTNLYYSIKEILNKALKHRGSSIDTYLDVWGNPGKYSYQHIVYGKEGQFCPHCPSKIMRRKVDGRSVYFCPGCQQ